MHDVWWVANNGSSDLNRNLTSRLETCDTKSRRVCDLERHPEWWHQQNWSLSELAVEAGGLGLPPFGTCAQSLFNSSVPSCLTTFSSLWAPLSKKPAKSMYFLKNTPSDQMNKEAFLTRKDHLLRFNNALEYSSCNCLHTGCHAGTAA